MENGPGEATFYEDEDLYELLEDAARYKPWWNGKSCTRHAQAEDLHLVGTPQLSTASTSVYTVITSPGGVLVSAFPGEG